jgi:hypothetical protein
MSKKPDENKSSGKGKIAGEAEPKAVTSEDLPKILNNLYTQYCSEARFGQYQTTNKLPAMQLYKADDKFRMKYPGVYGFQIRGVFPTDMQKCTQAFEDTEFLKRIDPTLLTYKLMSEIDSNSGYYYALMKSPIPLFGNELEISKLRCVVVEKDQENKSDSSTTTTPSLTKSAENDSAGTTADVSKKINKIRTKIYTSSSFLDDDTKREYSKQHNPKKKARSAVDDLLSCLELSEGIVQSIRNPPPPPGAQQPKTTTNFVFTAFVKLPAPLDRLTTERVAGVACDKLQLGIDYIVANKL